MSRPATTPIGEAMAAVLDGDVNKAILLVAEPETFVRASWLVAAVAPEAMRRAEACIAEQRSLTDRIGAYT